MSGLLGERRIRECALLLLQCASPIDSERKAGSSVSCSPAVSGDDISVPCVGLAQVPAECPPAARPTDGWLDLKKECTA